MGKLTMPDGLKGVTLEEAKLRFAKVCMEYVVQEHPKMAREIHRRVSDGALMWIPALTAAQRRRHQKVMRPVRKMLARVDRLGRGYNSDDVKPFLERAYRALGINNAKRPARKGTK